MSAPPGGEGLVTATASGAFRLLEHTADLRLQVRAPTPQRLYSAAVEALAAVLTDGAAPARPGPLQTRAVRLHGADPAELLVRLLNEVLYWLESSGRIAVGLEQVQLVDGTLEATARLWRPPDALAEALLAVKAATYSELRWEDTPDGPRAELTLDL